MMRRMSIILVQYPVTFLILVSLEARTFGVQATKTIMMRCVVIKNLILVFKDQMPLKRAYRNFFVTGNAWSLFHKNSHISQRSGEPKVRYNTKASSLRAAENMKKKTGNHFSSYKCFHCHGYHVGKNRGE
jgi:hypothetical protein